jgi:hypothetical protein
MSNDNNTTSISTSTTSSKHSVETTIDLETLNSETDGEYVIHNINKSIHPVHVMFRKLVSRYAQDLSYDPSTAALNLMKELKIEFPRTIVVKRIKIDGVYRFQKYHRMDAISKISHVISTKRFNNRKRAHTGNLNVTEGNGSNGGSGTNGLQKRPRVGQHQEEEDSSANPLPREEDQQQQLLSSSHDNRCNDHQHQPSSSLVQDHSSCPAIPESLHINRPALFQQFEQTSTNSTVDKPSESNTLDALVTNLNDD